MYLTQNTGISSFLISTTNIISSTFRWNVTPSPNCQWSAVIKPFLPCTSQTH
eukprot:TRINITY_DN4026_c0_g1_i1.p2 TRINITY_DN4026_c0_g1~~TRINITY_DN4026_c0_g1_i1.p2  ORF type:complete len:52 (+),score=5.86 TRINITY_DN4026_c0_g1_i1:77-232(+)